MIGDKKSITFFDRIRYKIETFLSNVDLDISDVIRLVSCFGIGFLCGLLLKRYVKYIILFIIFSILLLSILQYFDFISVHEGQIKSFMGFSEVETFDTIMSSIVTTMRIYALEVGISILGFLLGFKVG